MAERYWPLQRGRILTSPFGPRSGGFHYGADFGFPGGSGWKPVFAIQSGVVKYAGAASGYGGPDPNGWLVIESSEDEGGGCLEYGHIRRLGHVKVGSRVRAGEQIAVINPDSRTNGGTAPHLHLSDMPGRYAPGEKQDPLPRLRGAMEPGPTKPTTAVSEVNSSMPERPDFNEYWVMSPNSEPRNGAKVKMALLHTEEGGSTKDGADRLARWLSDPSRQVSYHYTISEDPDDHGVTVCDVTDTDRASWSARSANRTSINYCFAGSKASWSREEWLRWAPRAIDVCAYLIVQDHLKYGFPLNVVAPPYTSGKPGVTDHAYVTKVMRDGSHWDVGAGFPWDVLEKAIRKYSGKTDPIAPTPVPVGPADDQLTMRWNCLGGQTVVEALAEVRDKVLGTNDRSKTGVK